MNENCFEDINHLIILAGAFFDMYLGDVPVSEETKKEIGRNVAGLIGKC